MNNVYFKLRRRLRLSIRLICWSIGIGIIYGKDEKAVNILALKPELHEYEAISEIFKVSKEHDLNLTITSIRINVFMSYYNACNIHMLFM